VFFFWQPSLLLSRKIGWLNNYTKLTLRLVIFSAILGPCTIHSCGAKELVRSQLQAVLNDRPACGLMHLLQYRLQILGHKPDVAGCLMVTRHGSGYFATKFALAKQAVMVWACVAKRRQ